jgi:hypothetical protein
MASAIADIAARASLNVGNFSGGVNRMLNDADRLERRVGGAFSRTAGIISSRGAALITSLPVAAGLGAIQQAVNGARQTIEQDLNLGFLNDQLGTNIEWLSSLRTVANEAGIENQAFAVSIARVNQMLGQARSGNVQALASFQAVGLSLEQIQNGNFEQTFMDVARGLAEIPDRAIRAQRAVALFGEEGGRRLLRVVGDIDRALGDVQARGGFITDDDLESLERMDAAVDRFTTRLGTFGRTVVGIVAETINPFLSGSVEGAEGRIPSMLRTAADGFSAFRQFMFGQDMAQPVGPVQPQNAMQEMLANANGLQDFMTQFAAANNIQVQQPGGGMWDFLTGGNHWFQQVTSAFQGLAAATIEVSNAQRDAARIVEQHRTPMERFQEDLNRINDLRTMGMLNQDQADRATATAFNRIAQDLQDTPGIGSLDQGSAEVAAIIANASNPTLDVQNAILAIQQQELATAQRNAEIAEQVRILMQRQADAAAAAAAAGPIL